MPATLITLDPLIITAITALALVAAALIIVAAGRRRSAPSGLTAESQASDPTEAEDSVLEQPTLRLVAQAGREDEPADDVIGPGHPEYQMMMEAMRGNIVFAERDENGNISITSSRPMP